MESINLSRRDFVRGMGALGLSLGAGGLLTACDSGKGEAVHLMQMVYVGPGQSIVPRELKLAFERDHPGVTIELMEGTNAAIYPQMVAQKEVDPNKPLVNFGFFNADSTAKGDVDDMWVSLDPKKIPRMEDTYEQYRRPDNLGVAWGVAGMGLLYNTDLVEEPPTSWLDMFDPRFKGKVALFDYAFAFNGLVEVAYVLGGDEDNMDGAFEMVSKAAKDGQFSFFFTSNAQAKDALVTGNVLLEPFFVQFGITWGPKGEGGPVAAVAPDEGMMAMPVYMAVVKGSSQAQIDAASEYINTFMSPEWLSRHCNLAAQAPLSKYAQLDKDLALEPTYQPQAVENAMLLDWAKIAANSAEWKERWDREVKAYM